MINYQAAAYNNRWDELERLCIHSTLYTSLLNIYRMNFISGHDEEINQHFANLYQALISDAFSPVQAQNMRQALFNGNYFIVRERNEYSRLPRYDLPAALYAFIEKPPLIIERTNNRKLVRNENENTNTKNQSVLNVHTLLRKNCLDSIAYSNILHEMTKDILRDPFGTNSKDLVSNEHHPSDLDYITNAIPIISLQPFAKDTKKASAFESDEEKSETDDSQNGTPKKHRIKPMPKTDVIEIVEVDTYELINDCYTEILENEYKENGIESIPVIETEDDAIKFMQTWTNQEDEQRPRCLSTYYGASKHKFYEKLNENSHDELLCEIILDVLCESYNNQNFQFGMPLNSKLFKHKSIVTYYQDTFGCNKLNVNHWNYTLYHIRYLFNKFELLCVNEFTEMKLMATKLLRDNPKLAYFCIFPYTHDPNQWIDDKESNAKKKKVAGQLHENRHGITFDRDFEACYICNPWIRNGVDKKPAIDEPLVSNLREAVLSIIFH